jgi:regulator of nucleoside diphosphate kinase
MSIRSIYIAESYADELAAVLDDARRSYMDAEAHLRALEHEIAGARRVPADQVPDDFIAMYSRVCLQVSNPYQELQIQLVLPAEADISRGRVSLLAPIGAILGYRLGEEVDIEVGGKRRRIRILRIVHDPLLRRRPLVNLSEPLAPHLGGICDDHFSSLKHAELARSDVRFKPWHRAHHGVPANERPRSRACPPGHSPGVSTER